jgi:hypothetical protein
MQSKPNNHARNVSNSDGQLQQRFLSLLHSTQFNPTEEPQNFRRGFYHRLAETVVQLICYLGTVEVDKIVSLPLPREQRSRALGISRKH